MDFELSDEQQFLREAARGALSRHRSCFSPLEPSGFPLE